MQLALEASLLAVLSERNSMGDGDSQVQIDVQLADFPHPELATTNVVG